MSCKCAFSSKIHINYVKKRSLLPTGKVQRNVINKLQTSSNYNVLAVIAVFTRPGRPFMIYSLPQIIETTLVGFYTTSPGQKQIHSGSNFRIPGHFIYICRCALKNEVYNNSFYSYSNEVAEVAGYSEV